MSGDHQGGPLPGVTACMGYLCVCAKPSGTSDAPERDSHCPCGAAINEIHVVPAGMAGLKVALHILRGHAEVQRAGSWVAETARTQQDATERRNLLDLPAQAGTGKDWRSLGSTIEHQPLESLTNNLACSEQGCHSPVNMSTIIRCCSMEVRLCTGTRHLHGLAELGNRSPVKVSISKCDHVYGNHCRAMPCKCSLSQRPVRLAKTANQDATKRLNLLTCRLTGFKES